MATFGKRKPCPPGHTGGGTTTAPAAATHLEITGPLSIPAGGSATYSAQLKDASNVNVSTSGLSIAWAKSGLGGSLSATSSLTNSSGHAQIVLTASTDASVTHGLTATGGSLTGALAGIDVVPGTVAGLRVTMDSLAIDVDVTDVAHAQLIDGYGNSVLTPGRSVSWSVNNGGSMSAPTSVSDASGVAISELTPNPAGGVTHIVTATSGSFIASSATITVNPVVVGPGGGGEDAPDIFDISALVGATFDDKVAPFVNDEHHEFQAAIDHPILGRAVQFKYFLGQNGAGPSPIFQSDDNSMIWFPGDRPRGSKIWLGADLCLDSSADPNYTINGITRKLIRTRGGTNVSFDGPDIIFYQQDGVLRLAVGMYNDNVKQWGTVDELGPHPLFLPDLKHKLQLGLTFSSGYRVDDGNIQIKYNGVIIYDWAQSEGHRLYSIPLVAPVPVGGLRMDWGTPDAHATLGEWAIRVGDQLTFLQGQQLFEDSRAWARIRASSASIAV
jgi:hypothetical protein